MTSSQRQSNLLDEMEKTVSSYESKRSAPAPGTGAGDDDTYDESVLWVKFHFQDQVRRLKLSQKAYGELLAAVLPVVKGIDGSAGDAPLFLKYVDDEGELVNITSDGELSDAFAIAQKERRVLKIFASYTDPIDAPGSVATRSLDKVEIPSLMKAAVYRFNGPPEKVLTIVPEWPVPRIEKPTEVLVRVHACSINPNDHKMMLGDLAVMNQSFPFIPGFDVSGVIVKAGLFCKRLKPGDEVYGLAAIRRCGAFSEYVVMDEQELAFKPKNLSHVEAASFPLVALTGYKALVLSARLEAGQKLLILGGSGGAGSLAIQLAKSLGAYVVCTCSSRNTQLCRSLGADDVIDYTDPGQHWWEVLKGQEFDVIYDTVGGVDSWELSVGVLKKKTGRFLTIAGDSQEKLTVKNLISTGASVANRKFWSLFGGNKYDYVIGHGSNFQALESVRDLIERQAIKPVIDCVYNLDDGLLVFEHSMSGRSRGKVVVSIVEDELDQVKYPHHRGGSQTRPKAGATPQPSAIAMSPVGRMTDL